jgi:hypothetical protein
MTDLLENLTGFDSISDTVQAHPEFGNLLLTYVINQFTEPFRVAVLIYILPRVAHYFGKEL